MNNECHPALGLPLPAGYASLDDLAQLLSEAVGEDRERLPAMFLKAALSCAGRLGAHKAGVAEPLVGGDAMCFAVVPGGEESNDPARPITRAVPMGDSIAGYAFLTANAVISPDLDADMRFDDRFLLSQGLRSALVQPVLIDDRVMCTVGVFRTDPHDFALDEVCYAERLATGMAAMLKKLGWENWPESGRSILPSAERARAARELLESGAVKTSGPECRLSPRHEYRYVQRIAPAEGDQMPGWDEFIEVQCADLSGGGIALLLPERPNFRELIVALGRPPSLVHFAAHVVYIREAPDGGRNKFQVGCRFLRRVYL